jgi:membrane dipeptidase
MGAFIVDFHQDLAMTLLEDRGRDYGAPAPAGRALSLPDSRRGGLGLVVATIFAPEGYWKGQTPLQAAKRQLLVYDDLLDRFDQHLFKLESQGDLDLCQAGGPIGIVHLLEGADPVQSPDALGWWVEQGVRVVGLAWNRGNRYAGGTDDEKGLTDAGRDLLERMREQRVVCDVSHLNPHALEEVLAEDPDLVVASHSNAHAIHPHCRNLRDEHAEAIAERGGVVGVMLYGPHLAERRATIDDVVAHLEHYVEVAGVEHVGIGSDLDGGFKTSDAPAGIATVADLAKIGEALLARGWRETDVRRVMGGNWLRILHDALPD